MGAYFSMGPYIREVLLRMEMGLYLCGAYIQEVPIIQILQDCFSLLVRSGLPVTPDRDQRSNPPQSHLVHGQATVPVNKNFTFDDRRTIVLRCERLRFVPDEMVQERKRNGAKTVCKTVH